MCGIAFERTFAPRASPSLRRSPLLAGVALTLLGKVVARWPLVASPPGGYRIACRPRDPMTQSQRAGVPGPWPSRLRDAPGNRVGTSHVAGAR